MEAAKEEDPMIKMFEKIELDAEKDPAKKAALK